MQIVRTGPGCGLSRHRAMPQRVLCDEHSALLRDHVRVFLFAVKLLLAPGFVVGASVAARRFGVRVGGLIGGLPVVAGPILLVYALEHGRSFTADAAAGTLLGLVSAIAFAVVYARLAGRTSWGASLLGGWLAFAVATAAFNGFVPPRLVTLGIVVLAIGAGLLALPRSAASDAGEHAAPPVWDLPLRATCAAVLVLNLTAIAGWLGPKLSGLLAPFPILATVLATFTQAQRGTDELYRLLRGLVSGFGAFALFCFTLAMALRRLDTATAFALATTLALVTQGLVTAKLHSSSAGAPKWDALGSHAWLESARPEPERETA
jgi:hypothetical protein